MQQFQYYQRQKQTGRQRYYSNRAVESSYQAIRRRIRRRVAVTLFLVIAIGIGGTWAGVAMAKHRSTSSVLGSTALGASRSNTTPPATDTTTLASNPAITSLITQNSQYQIGVAVENMATKQQVTYGITDPFEAASTAKLMTAATYYHEVEQGQASLSDMIGSYPASYQLKEMVQDSDNDSWSMLVNALGLGAIDSYASSIGIHYGVTTNTLSVADMATFLTALYNGKLLNDADTTQLLSYMQDTNDEDLIPAVVPGDVTIYHKYGLLNGELHDVSILTKGAKAYALVIYTKDTDDSSDPDRTTIIHQIAQAMISQVFNES